MGGVVWVAIKINEIQKAIKQNPKNDESIFSRFFFLHHRRHGVVKYFMSNEWTIRAIYSPKCAGNFLFKTTRRNKAKW